jgi:hypothetical protein
MDEHTDLSRVSKMYFALCKSVDTPVALGAWLRFKYNHLALAEMEISPSNYLNASSFAADYLVVNLLCKYKGLKTGLDLEEEALRRFTASEAQCRESNNRIKASRVSGINPFTAAVISTAARKIARLLGPFDDSLLERGFGWGPGATDDIPRRRAFVDTKLCELPISVTRRSLPWIRKVISADLHWSATVLGIRVEDLTVPFSFLPGVFRVTETCIIDTVPKNAKTHRVIAKEPRANGFLQKGVGSYMRRRLKRVGIDLDNQGLNQDGAKRAFHEGLATLDLKAASDSVPIELIYELLPVDWAFALDDFRSHQAEMPDGSVITLQKFSSMGNGFTFELESLIFWAIASSVMSLKADRSRTLVYGDDIIIPSAHAEDVVQSLAFIGFSVNKEKSFISGAFYESCGKHYFHGYDVTPIYQKETIHDEVNMLRFGNRLIRYALGHQCDGHLLPEVFGAWSECWRMARETRQFQLPLGATGDDGWLLPGDYFASKPHDANLGLRCTVMVPIIQRFPARDDALLAWSLRRGVVTEVPYLGQVTSSPETTMTAPAYRRGNRWVMPSGEFGLNW